MSDFSEFHDELRSVAKNLLGGAPTMDRHEEVPPSLDWGLLAKSGWLGLEVPEALGGAGATFTEVAIVLQEMGRAATVSPYVGTVVLGVGALNLAVHHPHRDDLLRRVGSGDARVAVVVAESDDAPARWSAPFRLVDSNGRPELHGRCDFVLDVADAEWLVLLALDRDEQPVLVLVAPDAPGLEITSEPVLDATRRLGTVTADHVDVPDESVLRFGDDPEAGAQRLFDRGAVAVACDSLGLAEAMLDATVAYAGQRHQFGRPIGSFQAVKHACADMLVQVSVCRELLAKAVEAIADPDGQSLTATSMAKAFVCGTAVDVVGKAMQLHGGIGYTWESGIHLYLKRAALNRSLFGSPMAHRARVARRYVED